MPLTTRGYANAKFNTLILSKCGRRHRRVLGIVLSFFFSQIIFLIINIKIFNIMKHVFYFIGLLPLIYEILVVMNPKRVWLFKNRMKAAGKWDNYISSQKSYAILSLGYLFWAFIGLMSFNWFVFLIFIGLSFIPKKHYILMWIDSVISFLLLLFVILNSYHFQIDIFAAVRSFF